MHYPLLDTWRGFSLVSMIIYHFCWDLVYLCHRNISWYTRFPGYFWQQSICWSFIFLNGFCLALQKKNPQNRQKSLLVLFWGIFITIFTSALLPEQAIYFGILTFLGLASLIIQGLTPKLRKIPAAPGTVCCFLLFILTRNINQGFLGFEKWNFLALPDFLYNLGIWGSLLGFPPESFHSVDYFSLLPWIFLTGSGYFLCRLWQRDGGLPAFFQKKGSFLEKMGRHSLLIYLLHQPLLYLLIRLTIM
jgi:uncharacterized membrane protein